MLSRLEKIAIVIGFMSGAAVGWVATKEWRKDISRVSKENEALRLSIQETEELADALETSRRGSPEWEVALNRVRDRALLDPRFQEILNMLE